MRIKFASFGIGYNILMCFGSIIVGFFMDKFGRKFTIVGGGII